MWPRDWSSDVCSSDLLAARPQPGGDGRGDELLRLLGGAAQTDLLTGDRAGLGGSQAQHEVALVGRVDRGLFLPGAIRSGLGHEVPSLIGRSDGRAGAGASLDASQNSSR